MAITGHKSIHSLAIYQCVSANEKMMMGMSLTYSLLNAEEVYHLKLTQGQPQPNYPQPIPAQAPMPALPSPAQGIRWQLPNIPLPSSPPQNQAPLPPLDAQDNNILPLEKALVPYNSTTGNNTEGKDSGAPDFNFLEMLCTDMNDEDENNALTLAAQQVENQLYGSTTTTTTSKTALMTKKTPVTTFSGCSFGNIGTLNIHIHKHN